MKVRYFIYADKDRIFEMYNQLFVNITEIETNTEESKAHDLKAEVDLPNILQGFLSFNFSGEVGRDRTHTFSTKIEISIEEKVMSLISVAMGNETEPLGIWNKEEKLIVGYAKVLQYDYFEREIKRSLKKAGCKNFMKFVNRDGKKEKFDKKWKQLILENGLCDYDYNGTNIISFMRDISQKEPVTQKFIIVDWKYPTLIDFSLNKVLISASDMVNAGFFALATNIGILGVMRQSLSGLYRIKPIAMWRVVELDNCGERFVWQTNKFKEYWNRK